MTLCTADDYNDDDDRARDMGGDKRQQRKYDGYGIPAWFATVRVPPCVIKHLKGSNLKKYPWLFEAELAVGW